MSVALPAKLPKLGRPLTHFCDVSSPNVMCGIAGVWQPVGDLGDSVRAMTDSIRHRGPDADGTVLFRESGLALGHRRLSIVDLSPTGAQPMRSETGRFSIVFNGEIYNFLDLKKELARLGTRFRGSSDTEVMLAAFEAFGVREAIPRFAGMFAFAAWDAQENALWLARDRMGEKPCYYGQFGETFAFASELKALRTLENCPSDIDNLAVRDVLERGCIRGSRSIYLGIKKLPPGSCLKVSRRDGAVNCVLQRYWTVAEHIGSAPDRKSDAELSDQGQVDALDAVLSEVVHQEMISDVPLGAFLSGGIDSSLIVGVMQKLSSKPVRTFSIGFAEAAFDESAHARAVANHLGTAHTEIRLSPDSALSLVDRLPTTFDEPFADSSQLPTFLVSQATKAHVTVALSGDGGDELFGGYSQYRTPDSVRRAVARVPVALRGLAASALSAIPVGAISAVRSNTSWSANSKARLVRGLRDSSNRSTYESLLSAFVDPSIVLARARRADLRVADRFETDWPKAPTNVEAQMAYDMQTYLPDDILVKVDRSAMAVSLETRAPLLDHRVVEFALRLPSRFKIRDGQGKFILRRLVSRYVPYALLDRPKQGFAIPVGKWLRGPLKPWAEAQLTNDATLADWFDGFETNRLWMAHQAGADHADRLWRILMVLQWLRARRV